MAKMSVPTLTVPTVAPERGPVVYQDPGETRGAFGEGQAAGTLAMAKGLGQAGDAAFNISEEMTKAKLRIDERQDAIDRARALTGLRGRVDELYQAEKNGTGFSTPESVKAFRQKLDQISGEATSKLTQRVQGNGLLFAQDAEQLKGQYHQTAIEQGVVASKAYLTRTMGETLGELTREVADNPGLLHQNLARAEERIARGYAPGATDEETQAMMVSGKTQIAVAAIDYYNSAGDYKMAQQVMNDPAVSKVLDLSPELSRSLRLKNTVAQVKRAEMEAETNAKLDFFRKAGIPLDKTVIAASMGITLPGRTGTQTLAEKVKELSEVRKAMGMKPDVTADEISKISGALTVERDSAGERNRERLNELVPKIARRTVTPGEAAEFLALAQDSKYRPGVPGEATLAPHVALAISQWGGADMSRPMTMEDLARSPLANYAAGTSFSADPVQGSAARPEVAEGRAMLDTALSELPRMFDPSTGSMGATIFGMANRGLLTGPASSIADKIAGVPGIGSVFPADDIVRARTYLRNFRELVVRTMQQSPKFAEGEREQIRANLEGLEGAFFDTPQRFMNQLYSINELLRTQRSIATQTIKKGVVSQEEREKHQTTLNIVEPIMRVLGVPVPVLPKDIPGMIQRGELKRGDRVRLKDPATGEETIHPVL